jgi:hypothetical protein
MPIRGGFYRGLAGGADCIVVFEDYLMLRSANSEECEVLIFTAA